LKKNMPPPEQSASEWLDANVTRARVRETLVAAIRLSTYCDELDKIQAIAALNQLRLAMRGVIYIDEGWQKLVDALHSSAVTAGVNFVTSSRVIRVNHDVRRARHRDRRTGSRHPDGRRIPYLRPQPGDTKGKLPAENRAARGGPPTARDMIGECRGRE
jgi:phytoene dehydrogenase-like protein